jgi:hypothetical protein
MDPGEIRTLIEELEGEVNNGGFDQYFYNSGGDNTAEVIQALELIGAVRMADTVNRAAAKFPGGMPPKGALRATRCAFGPVPECNSIPRTR